LQFKKKLRTGVFVLAWFLIPLLIEMEIAKGFTPRYFIFVAPFALILPSYFVSEVLDKKKKVFIFALAVLLVPAALFEYQLMTNPESAPIPAKEKDGYLEEWSAGYGIKEIASYLKDQGSKGQSITVVTEGTQGYGTLPDGLEIYLRDEKNIAVEGINWALIKKVPDNLIQDAKVHPAYLVVNVDRLLDSKNPHLQLIASYPKANGKEPLLFYKVNP